MSQELVIGTRRTVGARDVPWVFVSPRRVFSKVEDVTAYGWPLVLLLTATALVGYAVVQTGLIDQQVYEQVAARKAELEQKQFDVVERSALNLMLAEEDKRGEFTRMVSRSWVVGWKPLASLLSILLASAILYGVVALTGRKPEWHTLMTICVFAGFVELAGSVFGLILMVSYGTLDVDLSARLLTPWLARETGEAKLSAMVGHLVSGINPFRIWFWIVVCIGLSVTSQLRGWRAWVTCFLCFAVAAGTEGGVALGSAMSSQPAKASSVSVTVD